MKFWRGHPEVEISLGLLQIGVATRERRPIDSEVFSMINDAAVKSPLAPEPLMVEGIRAQTSGNADRAMNAFAAAQWRNPRSLPAAYFLSEAYFRSGQTLRGLQETAILAHLSPGGTTLVAPFIAAYAQNRSNWPALRALFHSQPWLEDNVLEALATDARNTDAILAVADAAHRKSDSRWLPILLQHLVSSGDYQRAYGLWRGIGGGEASDRLLYDADFSTAGPPPPFNWSLTTSTLGLAERQKGKRLHAIFYGNDDGVLASELVLLPAGSYHLGMQLIGQPVHPEALSWSIRCDNSREPISSVALSDAGRSGWTFQVPQNCPAQWLELSGRSGEIAQQSEVTITGLRLLVVRPTA